LKPYGCRVLSFVTRSSGYEGSCCTCDQTIQNTDKAQVEWCADSRARTAFNKRVHYAVPRAEPAEPAAAKGLTSTPDANCSTLQHLCCEDLHLMTLWYTFTALIDYSMLALHSSCCYCC
jgi:hypothetical protein